MTPSKIPTQKGVPFSERLLTPQQMAAWIGREESWVRKYARTLPGRIQVTRETLRFHVRTFLEGSVKTP